MGQYRSGDETRSKDGCFDYFSKRRVFFDIFGSM